MYKQTLSFILILTCLALLPPVLAQTSPATIELTPAEQAWLAAHPDIRLGIDKNWIPYVKPQANGNIVGVAPDLFTRINALTGANIRLVLGHWADIVKQVERGELEGLAFSSAQPEREAHFLFSSPMFTSFRYIYTRSDKISALRSMSDLAGKKVGLQTASIVNQKILNQWPSIIQVSKESASDLAVALLNGEVDAVIAISAVRQWLQTEVITGIDVAFPVPHSETQVVSSIRKEYPELLSIINKAIAAIGPAELQQLLTKWSANEAPVPKEVFTEAEQAWLQQHPKIVLGISEQFQPEVIINPDGSYTGLIGDYFKWLNQQLDNRLQLWVESDWNSITAKAIKYEIDGLASSTPNPTWDKYFLYSQPYYYGYFHLYTRTDSPAVTGLADLAGKRVGHLAGIKKVEYLLQQVPHLTPVGLNSNEALARALLEGRVEVVVARFDLEWWRRQNTSLGIKIAGLIPESRHPVLMSIRNDWPLLPGILNKALNNIPLLEQERIRQRWLGGSAPESQGQMLLSAEERAYLKQTTLRRVIPADWIPLNFKDQQGTLTGIGEDYWALIRDKLGLHEMITGVQRFPDILQALQQNKLDLHISTTHIQEREDYLVFSDSYEQYPIAIATRQSAGFLSNTAVLNGQRVAVGKDYTAYYLLKARYPTIQFLQVEDTATALKQVADGRAFAAVDILPALQYQLAQFHGHDVVLAGVTEIQFPLQIAVRKEYARLLPLLNRAIATISPQERLNIQQKWMQQSIITTPDYTLLWQLTGVALLIISLVLYWNRRLAKEISLRKQTEQQLQDTSERLRSVLVSMDDLVFVLDAEGYFLECYSNQPALLLVPPELFLGKHYRETLPEHLVQLTDQAITAVQQSGAQHYEYSLSMPDGEHWYNASLSARYNQSGQFDGSTAVIRDVTQRRQMEEALRDSEARLRNLSDNLPDGLIYQIDSGVDGQTRRFTYISAGVEHLHGITVEEALKDAQVIYTQVLAEDRGLVIEQEARALASMTPVKLEVRCQLPNGAISWRLFTSAPRRLPNGHTIWDGIEIDITDRKRIEQTLRDSQTRYQTLVDDIGPNFIIYSHSADGLLDYVSKGIETILGISPEQARGRNFVDLIPWQEGVREEAFAKIDDMLMTSKGIAQWEMSFDRLDGTTGTILVTTHPVKSEDDTKHRIEGLVEDITERKRVEKELHQALQRQQQAEHFLRETIDALSAHLCVLDETGKILLVNRAWRKFADDNSGQTADYWIGYNYLTCCQLSQNLCDDSTKVDFYTQLDRVFKGEIESFQLEYPCHSPTEKRWFTGHVTRFASEPLRVVVAHENITRRWSAEDTVRQNEERYRSLVTAMAEGVIMHRDGEIVECNVAAERILGVTRDQIIGRALLDSRWGVVREDGTPLPPEEYPLSIVLRTGQAQRNVIRGILPPTGELRWLLINAEPLFRTGQTRPYAAVATFVDVTDSRAAAQKIEEQRRTLQAVLDHLPAAVQMFAAPTATPMLANRYAQELLQQEITHADVEALNTHYNLFVYGTDLPYPTEKIPLVRALKGETCMVEDMELRRLDGAKILLQVIGAPVLDEKQQITAGVVIYQDITERKQTEIKYRELSQRLEKIADRLPGVIYQYQLRPNGSSCFPYASNAIRDIYRVSPADVQTDASQVFAILHPEDYDQIVVSIQESAHTLQPWRLEYRVCHTDGTVRWLSGNANPELQDDGSILWHGFIADITARKQAELERQASQEKFSRIVATVPGVLYDYVRYPDGSNCFLYLSPRSEEFFEVAAEKLVRDSSLFWKLVHPEDLEGLIEADRLASQRGDYFRHETRIITPTGKLKWLIFHSRPNLPVPAGQPTVWTGHIIEITAQKKAEAELIQAHQAAEAANRAKSAFIANMNHELRTPLNAILGFAQILLQSPNLDSHQHDHVQRIQRGGEYLLTLINDILDLAKIEAGRFELFPTVWNTQLVFQELSDMFHLRAAQKHIDFHYESVTPLPQSLYSDDKRLRQILVNLLGNAVKFTERGTVALRTSYVAGRLCLEVVDSGIGIATTDFDKIFQPFQQTGADRYKVQGTGLGLAITYRLVQTMGGSLQVTSTLGQGSVFHVEIPVEAVSTTATALVDQPTVVGYRRTKGSGSLRVLEVDDLEDNRRVIRSLLQPLGFQVAEADNGQRCLNLVPDYQPDVILMDLRMPGIDGLQATRLLRGQGFQMPIIVLSAATFADDQVASLEAGGVAHLAKPVRLSELLETLAQWLPLEWNYADTPTPVTVVEEGDLESLTAEEAEYLRQLTLMGDVMVMEEFIGQLKTNHQQLGKILSKLLNDFEFDKIFELLEKCKGA